MEETILRTSKRVLIVAVALVSLVCFGLAFAQLGRKGCLADKGDVMQRDEMRGRMFDRLVEKLGLTEEQAEQLKATFKEHHQAMMELRDSLRDVLRAIREELAKEAPDESLLASLIAQADPIRERMKAEQDAFKVKLDEFKAGLTVTQQAKFLLFEARMHCRMGGPGGRGPGWDKAPDEAPAEPCPFMP